MGFTGHSISNLFTGLPQWEAASAFVNMRFGRTMRLRVAWPIAALIRVAAAMNGGRCRADGGLAKLGSPSCLCQISGEVALKYLAAVWTGMVFRLVNRSLKTLVNIKWAVQCYLLLKTDHFRYAKVSHTAHRHHFVRSSARAEHALFNDVEDALGRLIAGWRQLLQYYSTIEMSR